MRKPSLVLLGLLLADALCAPSGRALALVQAEDGGAEVYFDPAKLGWVQTNGPPGGKIDVLAQNPYRHDQLYAIAPNPARTYRSQDRGETWDLMEELTNISPVSLAAFEDRLFVAGEGLYCHYRDGHLERLLDGRQNDVVVSDGKLFAMRGSESGRMGILYADLAQGSLAWKDITPSEEELKDLVLPPEDSGWGYAMKPLHIVSLGRRLFVNIVVEVPGSGALSNGNLYVSEDLGETWSTVNLGTADDLIVTKITQHPENPGHLYVTLKHNVLLEFLSPASGLVRESFDGGKTWQEAIDLDLQSNGIVDFDVIGSVYYLLCPYDALGIVKINGSKYELIPKPNVEEFLAVGFNYGFALDTLLFDFDDPQVVYGKTGSVWSLGIVKSEDGMKTWKKIDRGIVSSSPSIVLVHPQDQNTIFTSGNVIQEKYATRNGGQTWEPFSPTNAGDELRIDPHDPDHLLLMSEMSDIYESEDRGRTFTSINEGFWAAKIFDLDVAGLGEVYVSNLGVGVSRSEDGEWRYLTNSPDYAYVVRLDPEDSSILYATYSPKKFENHSSVWKYVKGKAENFGWTEILRVPGSKGITSLTFDPSDPHRIYVGVTGQGGTIWVSNDKGATWAKLNRNLTFTTIWGHSQLQIDPLDKNTVYAGTWGGGTYKTVNAGKDWVLLDQDHTFSPTCLAVSTTNRSIIYACDRTSAKIHRSDDAGKTWYTYYDFGGNYMLTSAVAIDPRDPSLIYASAFKPPMAHQGAFIKIRNGERIADLGSGLPRSVLEIEIDPRSPNTLYVTTHIHGVFKSTDGGATWRQLDDMETGLPGTGMYDVDVDPTNSSILYATAIGGQLPDYMLQPGMENLEGKCGVYKSEDGGENWALILETVSEARGIDIDPADNRNLYVADMMGGVWVSNDGGRNWRQENSGLGSISMTSVKIRGNYIYASTQGSGVYSGVIRTDKTVMWDMQRSNEPKAEVSRIQVEVDPASPNRIYASAYPGGLLRSDDGGLHWNDKNFLTPSIRVRDPAVQGYYSFAISPSNPNVVWLGAYGSGMFVSYDGMDFDMFANGRDNKMMGKHITRVVINPTKPDEVYVASEEGIFVTRDNGANWEELNDGLQTLDVRSLKLVSGLTQPPFQDNFDDGNADGWDLWDGWRVVNVDGNYVLQGVGHSWANAGSQDWYNYTFDARFMLTQGAIHVNFRRSEEGRYFLALRQNGLSLWRQYDRWSEFAELVPGDGPRPITLNEWHDLRVETKGSKITVYLDGVLMLDYTDANPLPNGAIAFETLDDSQAYVDDVSVTVEASDILLYAGTGGYGVYKFDPASGRWENLGRTLGTGWWSAWERRMYQFGSILFDPAVPGRVYLGHFPGGFYVSEDGGHTWKDSSVGLGNDGIFSLTMPPHDPNVIWAGTYNGVLKSVDGGRTWQDKSVGFPPEQWPFRVAIDDGEPDVMYAVTKNGQNKGLPHRNQFHGVVMKSTDGGENWVQIMNGLDNRTEFYVILIHPLKHDTLFLSSNRGVYCSTDAGETWETMNGGLPTTQNQARDNVADNLAFTPDNRSLVLGLNGQGVWLADLSTAMSVNSVPAASFTYSPDNPTVRDTVQFNDSSADTDGSIVSWLWEFGDGATSTEQSPAHRYTSRGSFRVALSVVDDHGGKSTFSATLVVVNLAPVARFTFSPLRIVEGEEVMFRDMSEDAEEGLTSWQWDFGDGYTSWSRDPTHRYDRPGNYTVILVVTDDDGSRSLFSASLQVVSLPPIALVLIAAAILERRRPAKKQTSP